MLKICALALALCAVPAPIGAETHFTAPGWQDLEADYAREGNVAEAQRQMIQAIPAGTSARQALAELAQVGATCKAERRAPDNQRCLIHQYSLLDGAADDVRWTVHLQIASDKVSTIALDRDVDRHGSN